MIKAPEIDPRNSNDILNEFIKLVPFYTPEWFLTGTSGNSDAALANIFANMIDEIIKRINKAPDKHFISFLNMLGVKILPSQYANAPITFKLSEGTANPVLVPANTKLTASSSQDGSKVFFETLKNLLVFPSSITYAYSFNSKKDIITELYESFISGQPYTHELPPAAIYASSDICVNLQSHAIYIGHKLLNSIKGNSIIIISFSGKNINHLSNGDIVKWQYMGNRSENSDSSEYIDWFDFDSIELHQGTIYLYKNNNDEIIESEVNGSQSFWVRCIVKPTSIDYTSGVEIISADITTGIKNGLFPDKAFYNDTPIDLGQPNAPKEFYPLGTNPILYDTFYFSSKEAFSRSGARIEIQFEIKCNNIDSKARLSWEYWNGSTWQLLKLLIDETNNFTLAQKKKVIFHNPTDIKQSDVNGQSSYWIRVRLTGGDYGKESYIVKKTDPETYSLEVDTSNIKPPMIISMYITCEPQAETPDYLYIHNNLEYADKTMESSSFKPFYKIDNTNSAFYLCFSNKLGEGTCSIFFSFEEKNFKVNEMPEIKWEYAAGNNTWAKLKVTDNTRNFTCSGTIEIVGISDCEMISIFGKTGYWIRAIDTKGMFNYETGTLASPLTKGIFFNTTMAVNLETITGEVLGSSLETPHQTFSIQKKPVFYEEIWVNEIKDLCETEMENIKSGSIETFEEITDSEGNANEFWLKWNEVEALSLCSKTDRVYEIDRVLGIVKFGDGIKGAIPPSGTDNIKINYRSGGGSIGNVPAMSINALHNAIPFIDGVYNPLNSSGGFDPEQFDNTLKRGPQILRNRNRAVSYIDFEWLAMEASPGIAKAKCIPCMDSSSKENTGWVTVIIIPWSTDKQPKPSLDLKLKVQDFLENCTELNTAFIKHVRVNNPLYIEVSVKATIVASSFETAATLNSSALIKLDTFLHSLTGGFDGNGWGFGIVPSSADLFKVLQNIDGVKYVKNASMILKDSVSGFKAEISPNNNNPLADLGIQPYFLISSGDHTISVIVEE